MARLDRGYVSLPRWQLALLRTVTVRHDSVRPREKGISDHSPLGVSLIPVGKSSKYKPTPSFVTKHNIFKEIMEQWHKAVDLNQILPIERWCAHKTLMVEAAKATRDLLFFQDDPNVLPLTTASASLRLPG